MNKQFRIRKDTNELIIKYKNLFWMTEDTIRTGYIMWHAYNTIKTYVPCGIDWEKVRKYNTEIDTDETTIPTNCSIRVEVNEFIESMNHELNCFSSETIDLIIKCAYMYHMTKELPVIEQYLSKPFEEIQIKCEFFLIKDSIDKRAARGGLYLISLDIGKSELINLYVGEASYIAVRCAAHYSLILENPSFIGLKEEDIRNPNYTIKFEVLENVQDAAIRKRRQYKYIEEKETLTQVKITDDSKEITNDQQIKDCKERVDNVHRRISQLTGEICN